MLIKVQGTYFWREGKNRENQVVKAIEDMLRYDQGSVEEIHVSEENRHFTALVTCQSYTEGRWASFGLKTEAL